MEETRKRREAEMQKKADLKRAFTLPPMPSWDKFKIDNKMSEEFARFTSEEEKKKYQVEMVRKFAAEQMRWREQKQKMRESKKAQKQAAAGNSDAEKTPEPAQSPLPEGSDTDDGSGIGK